MSLHTSTQATHGPWDSREPMQLRFPFLWPPRGYSLWSRTSVHLPSLVRLLSKAQHKCQSHQWSSGALKPRAHPFPPFLLSPQSGRLESLPLMGRVCPELPLQTRHRPHPFQMRAGFPTSLIPMVRGTLRITGCRFMAPAGARRPGMRLMSTFSGPFDTPGNRLIVGGGLIPTTVPANGSGYLPVIFVSGFPARSSVPGTWVPSKSLER